ncbi:glycosyltransferase family 4 protein [Lachnospira multipara]|uniref:glycosyltransferase family 4 protein n=1 Tax=Lachnospira multipara TaxID=28051 RepID=UPI00042841A9|nr:glycosyltransferase family 4 protein [Lachnospira multipara]
MKRVMMLTTTVYMQEKFNKDNILILKKLGYEVDVVANFTSSGALSEEAAKDFKEWLVSNQCRFYSIDISRSPYNFFQNLKSKKQLEQLVKDNNYSFIHCHNPMGGVLARLVARKYKVKVIYTAHGFHFYEGAPIKNWLFYYPVEKFLSRFTDILITINREDDLRAKRRFHARKYVYIPGVGVDKDRINRTLVDIFKKKQELNIEDKFVFLAVGELQKRKNHQLILDAAKELKMENWKGFENCIFLISGKGKLFKAYEEFIRKEGLSENVYLLGYRNDVYELLKISDCFIHPSIREGLGIAPLEAMTAGLPLISTKVNGMKDYVVNNKTGLVVKPKDVFAMKEAIKKIYRDEAFRKMCSKNNKKIAEQFCKNKTNAVMEKVYKSI